MSLLSNPLSSLLAAALAACCLPDLNAQNLVSDLDTTGGFEQSSGTDPFLLFAGGSRAVFEAVGPYGQDLWVTDGSPVGTKLLADLDGIGTLPAGAGMIAIGNQVLFTARVEGLGSELWRTDGTPQGTALLVDLYPERISSNPAYYCRLGNLVYFVATDPVHGRELWRTDGTAAGTTLVIDIGTSPSPVIGIEELTVVGNQLFFTADNGTSGRELFVSDGTAAGTSQVVDLTPGSGGTDIENLAAFGNQVVFAADVGGSGLEPWISDGTAAGTFQLADLVPGVLDSNPEQWQVVGGKCVFVATSAAAGREVFATDGTVAGTQLLLDIQPGSLWSDPDELTSFGGHALFQADGPDGTELYRTNGTPAGTYQIVDLNPGTNGSYPRAFAQVGANVWFSADDGVFGREIYQTDGTAAGTVRVLDAVINGSFAVEGVTAFGSGVLLRGALDGSFAHDPCFSDGTAAGTFQLADINGPATDSSPALWCDAGNGEDVVFAARADLVGREVFRSGGDPASTQLLADVVLGPTGSSPTTIAVRGNDVFFDVDQGSVRHLARVAGTGGSAVQLTSGPHDVAPNRLTVNGNLVLFSASSAATGRELWVSNGGAAGTQELVDVFPGIDSGIAEDAPFRTVGGLTFFAADDGVHGVELWVTDGTAAGTSMVVDLRGGVDSSDPDGFLEFGGELYFAATSTTHGRELWRTNGTAAGTALVVDVFPGVGWSAPANLVTDGETIYFTARANGSSTEVFRCDGTAAGTAALAPMSASLFDERDLVATIDGVFWVDDISGVGDELWFCDGTPGTATVVRDIGPGTISGVVAETLTVAVGGTQVLFVGRDLQSGLQLWRSDGTTQNTQPVSSFGGVGYGAARIEDLHTVGQRTFFACDDGNAGLEPWVFDPVVGAIPFAVTYGTGCAGAGQQVPTPAINGLPTLGNASFAVTVEHTSPLTIAVPATAYAQADLSLGFGCRLLLGGPLFLLPATFTNAQGRAATPVPVPADPMLVGLSLYFQWAAFEPGGPFLGDFTLSSGLQMQIGN